MKRRLITLLIFVCLVALIVPMTVSAVIHNGWEKNGDYWYYYQDGVMVTDQVIKIGGVYYGFDENGIMYDDAFFYCGGSWYQANPGGALYVNQWVQDGGDWYYYGAEGKAPNDFTQIGGVWYFFDNGWMRADRLVWSNDYNNYYALNKTGTSSKALTKAGWHSAFGSWYYLYEDEGDLYFYYDFAVTIGGAKYYFYDNGKMAADEIVEYYDYVKEQHCRVIATSGGALLENGWGTLKGDTYYAVDGVLYEDEIATIDGKSYYFQYDGALLKVPGERNINGSEYYINGDGSLMINQWRKDTTGEPDEIGWAYYDLYGRRFEGSVLDLNGKTYVFRYGVMVANAIYRDWDYDNYFLVDENGYAAIIGTGWVKDPQSGENRYFIEGQPADGVITVDGVQYAFESSHPIKGSWAPDYEVGELYLFDNNGKRVTKAGWTKMSGNWYYLDSNGYLVQGWHEIGGVTYLFNPEMAANGLWLNENDNCYYAFNSSGAGKKLTGSGWQHVYEYSYYLVNSVPVTEDWKYIGGYWYYFNASGEAVKNTVEEIGGKLYVFNAEGKMYTSGWYYSTSAHRSSYWVYAGSDGVAYTGLKTIGGKQYYFSEWGSLYTAYDALGDVVDIDGALYWLNPDGSVRMKLKDGWNQYGGKWYYYGYSDYSGETGLLRNTLVDYNGNIYGFGSDGAMCTNGVHLAWYDYYIFDSNGFVLTGWQKIGGKWYYANTESSDPYVYNNGVYTINGVDYLFKNNTLLCSGTYVQDAYIYTSDANGVVVKTTEFPDGKTYIEYSGDGYCLYLKNGRYYTGWVGDYYAEDGILCFNQEIQYAGKYYYLGKDGRYVKSGWITRPDGGYSYAKADGTLCCSEWLQVGGSWYYFYGTYMVSDCVEEIDNASHRFDASGKWLGQVKDAALSLPAKADGWQKISGKWYYYYAGSPVWGEVYINGSWYCFDYDTCAMVENDFGYDWSGWYYYGSGGARAAYVGWKQIGGKWYYFSNNHHALQGLYKIGGSWYGFGSENDSAPAMLTNTAVVLYGRLYIFGSSGASAGPVEGSGWRQGGGKWFYLQNGVALFNTTATIGGVTYAFDYDGAMITNALLHDYMTYTVSYYNASGVKVTKAGWYQATDGWVYVNEGGSVCYNGVYQIGSAVYTFYDGYWVQ